MDRTININLSPIKKKYSCSSECSSIDSNIQSLFYICKVGNSNPICLTCYFFILLNWVVILTIFL